MSFKSTQNALNLESSADSENRMDTSVPATRCPNGATKTRDRVSFQPQLLNVKQCAEYLNISISHVRLYVKTGILRRTLLPDPLRRGHKLRRVLINKNQLDALIAESESEVHA